MEALQTVEAWRSTQPRGRLRGVRHGRRRPRRRRRGRERGRRRRQHESGAARRAGRLLPASRTPLEHRPAQAAGAAQGRRRGGVGLGEADRPAGWHTNVWAHQVHSHRRASPPPTRDRARRPTVTRERERERYGRAGPLTHPTDTKMKRDDHPTIAAHSVCFFTSKLGRFRLVSEMYY